MATIVAISPASTVSLSDVSVIDVDPSINFANGYPLLTYNCVVPSGI
ncbi:hypothetical protein [uncultured Methanobrevibacter sp.]|nr:hypothetical protein [uncultured Methanobrevibacter sp.]